MVIKKRKRKKWTVAERRAAAKGNATAFANWINYEQKRRHEEALLDWKSQYLASREAEKKAQRDLDAANASLADLQATIKKQADELGALQLRLAHVRQSAVENFTMAKARGKALCDQAAALALLAAALGPKDLQIEWRVAE